MTATAIAKGLLTYVVPSRLYNRSEGRTLSARYCYSVFLRHLIRLGRVGAPTDPRVVAEIGPGASIGAGLAALLAGAETYYGFDIKAYHHGARTLAVFDALVALLRGRAPVPDERELPNIKPALDDHRFPAHILTDERLARALAPERVARLRRALTEDGGPDAPITYRAPWFETAQIRPGTVDWIFSQAVMEHVDDLDATYRACRAWLAPTGVMSHQIDFKSHGTAAEWNGHWAYSDTAWRLVRGARLYLVNRQPHSAHRAALARAGFTLLLDEPVMRDDGLPRARLAPRYRALDDADLATAGAFMIARPAQHPGLG
ncbi:MAG TPA: methyltransferase domain-containing protein [Alphaproteobacteria bacterium]|jgi:SAM-dependent methyltransferase|nr:methyltransferase domain-containing protein [Alphaproteobacteria bacterium]